MRVHLITLVGGNVDILPFMLKHYQEAGIESLCVNVHLSSESDPLADSIRVATDRVGCGIAAVTIGRWHPRHQLIWKTAMRMRSDEWCVLADQDELQLYPDNLISLLKFCDRRGYEYITGAFVDRVSCDGSFPPVAPNAPLWSQFPLGGFISYPMISADPRKVVAAKGRIPLSVGHHIALAGRGCPMADIFVQVHHFKWTAGLVDRMKSRAATFREQSVSHWTESAAFVSYFDRHSGRIDTADPRFAMARCTPTYPGWNLIRALTTAITERSEATSSMTKSVRTGSGDTSANPS